MLPKGETIEGVDFERTFQALLNALPWRALLKCVQANKELLKACTLGGYRLDPKRRSRVQKVVLEQARKAEFSDAFCSPFFAEWYPTSERLYKRLEEYFHSEDYKAYREQQDIEEGRYLLPDEKFEEFFDPKDVEAWTIALCFSPLEFTPEQARRIVSDSEGNVQLLEQIQKLQKELDELRAEHARLGNEAATLRRQQEQAAADLRGLRSERKKLLAERDNLQKRAEAAHSEIRRLRSELPVLREESEKKEKELRERLQQEQQRARDDLTRLRDELASWRSRYEQQCNETRRLEEELEETEKQLVAERTRAAELEHRVQELQDFATLILQRIDWTEIGRQMKLTGQMRRLFSSLVRKLNYEEDRPVFDQTLTNFWNSLMEREKALIESVAQSNTLEVMQGSVEQFWRDLTDAFEDVQFGLEARTILLKLLHEIFYQVIEMEDLKTAKIDSIVARGRRR